jgi:hypothetical protein
MTERLLPAKCMEPVVSDESTRRLPSRRTALTAGGVAAAGAVAAVVATPVAAQASNGSALILGRANSATAGTSVSVTSTSPAMTVTNSGAAALFQSTASNGFAGGSHAVNGYGLSAVNYSTSQGGGAAVAAGGGVNTGILANTKGNNRFAVNAVYQGSTATFTTTGAGLFNGGVGHGVVGYSAGDPSQYAGVSGISTSGGMGVYGTGGVGVSGYAPGDQGIGVWGSADNDAASVGVMAQGSNGATAIVAVADTGLAMNATGDVYISGNLAVGGTVTPGAPPPPTTPQAQALVRKATKMRLRFAAPAS